jgi:tyrosyl-tRNA synthetase
MKLSEELKWRGFIQQTTLHDIKLLDEKQWTFYHGFDASADSQTIGNLAAMMFDKVFMRHDHKAILLAGGSTSLIGDPGGKDKERPMQTQDTISENVKNAANQLTRIMDGQPFILVNNLDWTKNMKVLDFLRDIGKNFSMTPLVQRDYIAKRIGDGGSGISYSEFSYTLLQGMDFLHLYDNYGCNLQLGGSDQWGNCLSGVELIRRMRGAEVHVVTHPLVINRANNKKFGKSEDGAVWLDSKKTSVFDFYQFWLNLDDDGVEDYIKIYTEMSKPEVDKLMSEHKQNPHERTAQKALALAVTKIVHGNSEAQKVELATKAIFGGTAITVDVLTTLREILPVVRADSMNLVDMLIRSGLAESKTDARRFVLGGAVYVNNEQHRHEEIKEDQFYGKLLLLRRGKNKLVLLER